MSMPYRYVCATQLSQCWWPIVLPLASGSLFQTLQRVNPTKIVIFLVLLVHRARHERKNFYQSLPYEILVATRLQFSIFTMIVNVAIRDECGSELVYVPTSVRQPTRTVGPTRTADTRRCRVGVGPVGSACRGGWGHVCSRLRLFACFW